MIDALNCYFTCIAKSSTNYIVFGLLMGALIFGIIFLFSKRPYHMFLSQIITSLTIVEGFRQMTCSMSQLVWLYFGLISGAMVFLGIIQIALDRRLQNLEIIDAHLAKGLSRELGCNIYLLDTQKIKAFTHRRRIYLSVGLVELLDPDELKAVVAHEKYHVLHTPNRFMANTFAVASLWLKSYRDDAKADRYAAELAGPENLKSAFDKLGIAGNKRRARRLAV